LLVYEKGLKIKQLIHFILLRFSVVSAFSIAILASMEARQGEKGKAGRKVRIFLIYIFAPILGC